MPTPSLFTSTNEDDEEDKPSGSASANEDRDSWIYEKLSEGMPYKEVLMLLPSKDESWEPITTHAGLRFAADGHARRTELPKIRRRS